MSILFIEYLLPSALSLTVFYLLYKVIVRNDTHLQSRRFLILAFLIFAIVLPFLSFQLPMQVWANFYQDFKEQLIVSTFATATEAARTIFEKPLAASIWQILGYIYVAVSAVLLLRFLIGILHLSTLIKKGKHLQAGKTTIILGLHIHTAFSFFNKIFMPETWYNSNGRNLVLKHEQVHVRQKHSWDLMLMELICIVQFFNPFAWLLKREMCLNHEFLADKGALKDCDSAVQYFELLFQKIKGSQPILAHSFTHSPLKNRIKMSMPAKSAKSSKILSGVRYLIFTFVALFLTVIFAVSENPIALSSASSSTLSNALDDTKYLVSNEQALKTSDVKQSETKTSNFIASNAEKNNMESEFKETNIEDYALNLPNEFLTMNYFGAKERSESELTSEEVFKKLAENTTRWKTIITNIINSKKVGSFPTFPEIGGTPSKYLTEIPQVLRPVDRSIDRTLAPKLYIEKDGSLSNQKVI